MRIFLALTPWRKQKNVGDHSQALLITEWIKAHWPNSKLFEYPTRQNEIFIKQKLDPSGIIILNSGGNMGDLWISAEYARRDIISTFKNNRIISMPQTIHFANRGELEKSKKIYNEHPNLTILTRDFYSYAIAKEHFYNTKVFPIPDIVFTHQYTKKFKREGILLCLRSDKESMLSSRQKRKIKSLCEKAGFTSQLVDTTLDRPITNRRAEMNRILEIFSKSQAVITDRLHGVIFSAVSNTPCVAMPTINHKITETYHWFRQINFVKFCDSINHVIEKLRQAIDEPCNYNPNWAKEYYNNLLTRTDSDSIFVKPETLYGFIKSRRSIRKWNNMEVPDKLIQEIITAGIYAPCGANAQCTRFKIISDPTRIAVLTKDCFGRTTSAPNRIILVGYDRGVPGTVNFQDKNYEWRPLVYQDVAAAVQNMLLYCEALGLSACWLSFFTQSRQKVLQDININVQNVEFISGIAIGYAKHKYIVEPIHQGNLVSRRDYAYYIR